MEYLKKEFYNLISTHEDAFDFIQESGLDGIWFWDLTNPVNQWANPKLWATLGYHAQEFPLFKNKFQTIAFEQDVNDLTIDALKHFELYDSDFTQTIRFVHKNQQTIWMSCQIRCLRNAAGKPERFLCAATRTAGDITETGNEEASKFHQSVLNSQSIYIARINLQGNYTYVNEYFCKAFDYTEAEVIGTNALDTIVIEDHQKCFETGQKCFDQPGVPYKIILH